MVSQDSVRQADIRPFLGNFLSLIFLSWNNLDSEDFLEHYLMLRLL